MLDTPEVAAAPSEAPRAAAVAAAIEVRCLRKSFGPAEVLGGIDLAVRPGTTVVLLGPSGCGKTTLLRCIAGLERPESGTIRVDGAVVADGNSHVPPEKRRIGMVFQDWALFPHLDVAANVGYGLSRAERTSGRVAESLELVGLGGYGGRMPSTLSGGQQQRVALARALAPRPRAILFDEPFSNLDTALRSLVRTEVHSLISQLGITTVFVTHDQEEAFVLGDEVAVMRDGEIVQQARPAEIYSRPATPWVAAFVGEANLVAAEASGSIAKTSLGLVALQEPHIGPVRVLLRPEQLLLSDAATAVDTTAHGAATVELVEFYGHDHVTIVRGEDGTELRVRSPGSPRFRRGDRVTVAPLAVPVTAFDATG